MHHKTCWSKLPPGEIGECDHSDRWHSRRKANADLLAGRNREMLADLCRGMWPDMTWRCGDGPRRADLRIWNVYGRAGGRKSKAKRMVEFYSRPDGLTFHVYVRGAVNWILDKAAHPDGGLRVVT